MTTSLPNSGLSNLFIGRSIDVANSTVQYGSAAATIDNRGSTDWTFRPGVYTPKQFIKEIATLVESVIIQLGPDSPGEPDTRSILFDGLRSSLSHEGREATLHLPDWNDDEPSEVTQHVLDIGKKLYNYAREYSQQVPGNKVLSIYSPCEGHRWVPPAGRLLRSHRSSPTLMMLYNEWLHQITCLRDGLIPFENFEQVKLNLFDPSQRGARPMENVRAGFLSHIIRGRLPHEAIVETAKVLTAPNLAAGGYGFQYDHGVVLPASLFSVRKTPFLHFAPTALVDSSHQPVIFKHEPSSNQKTQLSHLEKVTGVQKAALRTELELGSCSTESAQSRLLQIVGSFDQSRNFTVDVGRIVQGVDVVRFVSRKEGEKILRSNDRIYEAVDILVKPGVVVNDTDDPVIIRASNIVERLALLGKLEQAGIYWDSDGEAEHVSNGKKPAVPRFLIVGGQ